MRIAIAQVRQETNTFSPVAGTLEEFKQRGLYYNTNFLDEIKSRGEGEISGFLNAAEEEKLDIEFFPILRAYGGAGGRVDTKALKFFEEKLTEGLKKALPLDGMYFALHGAANSQENDDLEGYVLSAVLSVIGNDVPIVASLDHHANITKKMVRLTDMMVGDETQPHKHYETGRRAS